MEEEKNNNEVVEEATETNEEVKEEAPVAESTDDRKMFPATCSECGNACEVPFEPTEGKPVKCRDCFKKGRSNNGGRFNNNRGNSNGGRNGGRDNSRGFDRQMFPATCSECGNKCEVPFKPREGGSVKCRDCFSKN